MYSYLLNTYIFKRRVLANYYVTGPPGAGVLLVGVVGFGIPVLVNPVGSNPGSVTVPADVGVVGLESLGVVGRPTFKPGCKEIVKVPPEVGVSNLTGLAPGVEGVVGVVIPVVKTPVTVRTVNVEGFFMALMFCRSCDTLVQRRGPILPNSFSY